MSPSQFPDLPAGPDADLSCTKGSPTGQISLLVNLLSNVIHALVPRPVIFVFAALLFAPTLATSQYANPSRGLSLAGIGHDRDCCIGKPVAKVEIEAAVLVRRCPGECAGQALPFRRVVWELAEGEKVERPVVGETNRRRRNAIQ